jgi:hypothetical protein
MPTKDPLCTQESNHPTIEDLHGTTKEEMRRDLNEEVNQKHHDFIESWFQATIIPYHCLILHYFLTSSSKKLVLHTHVYTQVHLSNPSMSVLLHLSCT